MNILSFSCSFSTASLTHACAELIFLLQMARYDELLVPSPSWVSYTPQAEILGRPFKWIDCDSSTGWQLSAEVLEEECASDPLKPRLLILNYPNNPGGCTYTKTQVQELAKVCKKYDVLVLSDEIYAPLMHEQSKMHPIHEFCESLACPFVSCD